MERGWCAADRAEGRGDGTGEIAQGRGRSSTEMQSQSLRQRWSITVKPADSAASRGGRPSYADFELAVREWERLADTDGAEPANSRGHDNRSVSLHQDHFDLSWTLKGSFGAVQGATMADIFDHYVDAERLTDWEKAKAQHGDNAVEAQLPGSEWQRRADGTQIE